MFGSTLYFITLLACTEMNIAEIEQSSEIKIETTAANNKKQEIAQPEVEEKKHSICITNAIEDSMLAYKHWTGTYTPDMFTITINDTEVARGQNYIVTNIDDPITVICHYSFMNGMRSGNKTAIYALHKESTRAQLTFSWLEPHKIIIDNASLLQEVT